MTHGAGVARDYLQRGMASLRCLVVCSSFFPAKGTSMGIALTVRQYLEQNAIDYEVLPHHRTTSSLATAHAAHVPAGSLAKSVILEDEAGFLMAVVPANCRLELGQVHRLLKRALGLATEETVAALFQDCETGAVPALGDAYGMEMLVDDSLVGQPEIYFEGGNHRELLHMPNREFRRLLTSAQRGHISHPIA